MSDPTQTPPVRPMLASDYSGGGQVITQPPAGGAPCSSPAPIAHPTRDMILAAVIGAAAIYLVPKAIEFVAGGGLFDEGEEEETFEVER
jgi:hypothetical protein